MDHYGSSLTASDLHIFFVSFFDYLFPASAWYNWKKKANIEVYTLQLSDSIFLLLNIYKIDVF